MFLVFYHGSESFSATRCTRTFSLPQEKDYALGKQLQRDRNKRKNLCHTVYDETQFFTHTVFNSSNLLLAASI